jgi:CDP-diacylglycerol--glycerol-3-phosphate 3-phosphatidyltransferase
VSPLPEWRTWANLVTLVRTAATIPLGLIALTEMSMRLLILAYAVYWVGDVLDGCAARKLDQETRLGAVFDIISDRVCCCILVCVLTALRPEMWPALGIFLLQFMVLDCILSLTFLRWPVKSPNYFYLVDDRIWRYNWSPPAKTVNTVGSVAAVLTGILPLALIVAVLQFSVKLLSARRVLTLPARPFHE